MRQITTILFVWTIGQCQGGTFDFDTVDNWQVYNGAEFVLGGHDSPLLTEFRGAIKTADLNDLSIQFNHCVRYSEDFDITILITDDKGQNILTKTFMINSGTRMTIAKKELGRLTAKSITIRYIEKRRNGTDRILGRISLV